MKFYCQNISGSDSFSIAEWNETYNDCLKRNASEEEMNFILHPAECKHQCFDCMAIVGERQLKTKELIP